MKTADEKYCKWAKGVSYAKVNRHLTKVHNHEHTKNKGRNTYKGFLPFFEKPGAITTTPHITAAAL